MKTRFLVLAMLPLLCRCAAKHQSIVFAPYFPDGYEVSVNGVLAEQARLLARKDLTVFEKLRLSELYEAEMRSLRPSTDRYQELSRRLTLLAPQIEKLQKEIDHAQTESKIDLSGLKLPAAFKNAQLRKVYVQAQQLWNHEQNEAAFAKLNEILSGVLYAAASNEEKFRIQNLKFRIAVDLGNEAALLESFSQMKKLQGCAAETAQAALALSLRYVANGDPQAAEQTFSKQCDPDNSTVNELRRRYWTTRFAPDSAPEGFRSVVQPHIPGYYSFLAQARLENKISLPFEIEPETTSPEFETSEEIHRGLISAENYLSANLRRDAGVYLINISQKLKTEVNRRNLDSALYTATLLQAAGLHLEALKLYSACTVFLTSPEGAKVRLNHDVVARMFPRPFAIETEWLAKLWGVDPDFVYAIMRQESGFNPEAVSATGARGLMQMMPATAKQLAGFWRNLPLYNDRLLFSPPENLKVAIFYIHQLQELLPNPALVAAAYNAGFHRVVPWMKKFGWLSFDAFVETIPINETRQYVKLVMRNLIYYKALRTGQPVDAKILLDALPYIPATASNTFLSP